RSGTADVRPKGAERAELLGQQRRGEVVRRQRREIAGGERLEQHCPSFVVPGLATTRIEFDVDGRGRRLFLAVRKEQEHREGLRDADSGERAAVTFSELRPLREEERHVGTQLCGELSEPRPRKAGFQRLVRKRERGCSVRATA